MYQYKVHVSYSILILLKVCCTRAGWWQVQHTHVP